MKAALTFPWIAAPSRLRKASRTLSHVPRMASSVVRIPDARMSTLPLRFSGVGPQIFVHEGARQALERRFAQAHEGHVQLSVTDNRRRMVTHTLAGRVLKVRVHMMFLDAPERVVQALVRYVVQEDRRASEIIGEFIEKNSHRIRAVKPTRGPLRTKGRAHDLYAILQDVATRYFGDAASNVLITWGRKTPARKGVRQSIKLGTYSATERLIRIHPVLDRDWVPRYFVSYIVYHELLHHLVPAVNDGGRALLHTTEFLLREREFRHYERAITWEQKHIHRLLRAR